MIRLPPNSTQPSTLYTYPTCFRSSPAAFEPRMRQYGFRYILHAFNSEPDLRDLLLARGAGRPPDQVGNLAWIDGSLRTGTFETTAKRWNTPLLALEDVPPTWDRLEIGRAHV